MANQSDYYTTRIDDHEHFTAQLYLDFFNKRVRLDDYRGRTMVIVEHLKKVAEEFGFSKIIVKSRQENWQQFLSCGFMVEGVIRRYFSGNDAYFMSYFLSDERRTNLQWKNEDQILEQVQRLPQRYDIEPLPAQFTLRAATTQDSTPLAELYNAVFQTYPTPMNNPKYIESTMEEGTLYYLVLKGDEIISAASAEIQSQYHNAEITDCATLPNYRGFGLMRILIAELEKELYTRKIYFLYSLARSLSFGMNAALHQLGYVYAGRMTNNCFIFDKIENMSIWAKDLTESQIQIPPSSPRVQIP